jgi:hypothetical protein
MTVLIVTARIASETKQERATTKRIKATTSAERLQGEPIWKPTSPLENAPTQIQISSRIAGTLAARFSFETVVASATLPFSLDDFVTVSRSQRVPDF